MCGIAGYSLSARSSVDRTLAAQSLLAGIAERGADAVGFDVSAAAEHHEPAEEHERRDDEERVREVPLHRTTRRHELELVGDRHGALAEAIPADLLRAQLDALEADGGWPSPYDRHWRPWATAEALHLLKSFGRLGN